VVGDVGGEVGGLAVGSNQDPVLVVAELARPQPHRALPLVHVAAASQIVDRRLDLSILVEGALREPGVEADPEAVQRRLYPPAHLLRAAPGEILQVRGRGAGDRELIGELGDVLAGIAVIGRLAALHPRGDRLREEAHLAADVVQQVLPLDVAAGELQTARQRVPVRGPPPAGDGEWAGRVCGHELH
jgi:hypothetical protein